MIDCGDDVTTYHDDEVALDGTEQKEMRDRRNTNRTRLRNGLVEASDPAPVEIASQGSYAMHTMVQYPEKDYDIDDGVYFDRDDLVGDDGKDTEPEAARQMVCDALADERFTKAPKVMTNCARVFYDAGYHIDMPVYRRTIHTSGSGEPTEDFELAAGPDWKASDARAVTDWFNDQNKTLSPDETNGRQFRRVVKLAKKFSRSRSSWGTSAGSGLLMTKLCSESFRGSADRDDEALRRTLEAVRDRLKATLVVDHPVNAGDKITKGNDDEQAAFLRDKLTTHLSDLDVLDDPKCDRPKALRAWADFFNDGWFRDRATDSEKSASGASFVFSSRGTDVPAVDKRGGGKYA